MQLHDKLRLLVAAASQNAYQMVDESSNSINPHPLGGGPAFTPDIGYVGWREGFHPNPDTTAIAPAAEAASASDYAAAGGIVLGYGAGLVGLGYGISNSSELPDASFGGSVMDEQAEYSLSNLNRLPAADLESRVVQFEQENGISRDDVDFTDSEVDDIFSDAAELLESGLETVLELAPFGL
jgi:hypothetical protein